MFASATAKLLTRTTFEDTPRPDYKGETLSTVCRAWQGATGGGGYGQAWWDGKVRYAHILAWEDEHGPVPDGLQIDHLCRNKPCWNPAHLEAVTFAENLRRGARPVLSPDALRRRTAKTRAARLALTHCARGHPYDEENTYVDPHGWRNCRTCKRGKDRARWRAERGWTDLDREPRKWQRRSA